MTKPKTPNQITIQDLVGQTISSIEQLDDDGLKIQFDNSIILFCYGSTSLETTKAFNKRRKKLAELSQKASSGDINAALETMKFLADNNRFG